MQTLQQPNSSHESPWPAVQETSSHQVLHQGLGKAWQFKKVYFVGFLQTCRVYIWDPPNLRDKVLHCIQNKGALVTCEVSLLRARDSFPSSHTSDLKINSDTLVDYPARSPALINLSVLELVSWVLVFYYYWYWRWISKALGIYNKWQSGKINVYQWITETKGTKCGTNTWKSINLHGKLQTDYYINNKGGHK